MNQTADQHAATPAVAPQPQRVSMSRNELDLYIRDGRPTGLLLRSVALLKGISVKSVAKSSGIPAVLVQAIFDDQGLSSVKKGSFKRVAAVLGIDLTNMRFSAGQVHVFKLGNIPLLTGPEKTRQMVRAVGLLARNARVAEVATGGRFARLLPGARTFVAQTTNFRVLFVGSALRPFDISHLPSATWVCQTHALSVVRLANEELEASLSSHNLTEGEFDELFLGSNAFTWEDIRVASRVNGVSKRELMEFISSRAAELDQRDDIEAKRVVIENAPFLRLVENDQRAAA